MRRNALALLAAGTGLVLVLGACGSNAADGGASSAGGTSTGRDGTKVGVILPETATSARWESFDKPILAREMRAAGLDPDIQNAQGDTQKFANLADEMIN